MYDNTDSTKDNQAIPAPAYTGPMGWRCPVCKRGNSPLVGQCPCSGEYPTYIQVPQTPWYPPYPWGVPVITCCADRGATQG